MFCQLFFLFLDNLIWTKVQIFFKMYFDGLRWILLTYPVGNIIQIYIYIKVLVPIKKIITINTVISFQLIFTYNLNSLTIRESDW